MRDLFRLQILVVVQVAFNPQFHYQAKSIMLYDSSSAPHLKPWLVRTLEPICDAEPGALADYILALLKHNVPESEMRKELAVQLDEFLEKECASFIDTLFTVLRTKSYLPYGTSPSDTSFPIQTLDSGIPIPLDGLLASSSSSSSSESRIRKRSTDGDERDGRPPAKGPRLSTEGQFSRYANGTPDSRSTGGWGGRDGRNNMNGYGENGMDGYGTMMMGGGSMGSMNGMGVHMNGRRTQAYQPPDHKRGICRDYYNNGFCARGVTCRYSHGEDAVVPEQLYPMGGPMPGGGMPFLPMFMNAGVPFGAGGAYDPHEARMDMRRTHNRAPLLPRIQQEDGRVVHPVNTSGELPVIQDLTPTISREQSAVQDLTPGTTLDGTNKDEEVPSQNRAQTSLQQSQQTNANEIKGFGSNDYGHISGDMNGHPYIPSNTQMDFEMTDPSTSMGMPLQHMGGGHMRGGRGGGGRGRGSFGDVHKFRPERRNDKTLVVEKIPEDKLTMELINGWFKRFGTVTNVAIDLMNAKALVSFLTHDEAHAAWKSEDAVFNNRFVKLFWHRPMEGHGQIGARMLAASAPLVANIAAKDSSVLTTSSTTTPAPVASTSGATATPKKPAGASSTTLSALAAKQQQIEQQIAEQKTLMGSLESASAEEKKDIMARLRKLGEEMKAGTATSVTAAPPTPSAGKKIAPPLDDQQKKMKERLDKELEMHASVTEGEQTTESLQAKLERLKAEAASLGIADIGAEPSYGGSYRGYRGRGRGARSFYRGAMRGGPPRASMKLDNRPKKLFVKGVRGDGIQSIRDWFESTGQLDSLDTLDHGDLVASFKTRAAAEQALAKGNNVPTVGTVQISWFMAKPMAAALSPSTTAPPSHHNTEPLDPSTNEQEMRHSPGPEEGAGVRGWGGDDDGDGMGML